ncbi:MAG: phenylacetate--CoA ligase family protein [Chromatiales bacterium]|nr:phenylacetate--CoA ligase family protein [Chromatiales bacterium]
MSGPNISIEAVLEMQNQLADSQWLEAAELRAQQFEKATALVEHAWRTVPWYRERLAIAGIRPGVPLTEADWLRIPILSRREVQALGFSLKSDDVPPSHGEVVENRSSGSTGTPVRALGTVYDALWFKAIELRFHLWHDRDFEKPLTTIRKRRWHTAAWPEGETYERWGDMATFPFPTGPRYALNTSASTAEQLDWLQRRPHHYLMSYPSNVRALALHCRETGAALAGMAQIITVGEVVPNELRELCREVFGAVITDGYSAMEVGQLALQCPEHEHYHVQSERLLVEVVDDDGQPCGPGQIGRVLVTPLLNYAMPLLRYALGDYAEVGALCECGRGLPVLTRILGRQRNTLITPDGGRYWPSFGTTTFLKVAPIVQHQFVQHSVERLEGRFVVKRPLTEPELVELRELILSAVPYPFEIELSFHDSLERSASGKWEDFISHVDAGPR